MNTKMISLIATVAIIAIAAVGIGYAYTAFTVNDGNSMATEYATLTQTNYNFATNDNGDTFDTKTATQNAGALSVDNPLVTTYKLNSTTRITGNTDATTEYYGVTIGNTDTLTVTQTGGNAKSFYKVTIDSLANFKDFSGNDAYWCYILKITAQNKTDQFIIFNGGNASTQANVTYKGYDTEAKTDGIYLVPDITYTTTLYFGGLGTQNLIGVQDDSAYGAQSTQQPTEANGSIISTGSITFKADPVAAQS